LRNMAGVSARSATEQANRVAPRRTNFQRGESGDLVVPMKPGMKRFCGEGGKKPIALEVRKICYWGPGTGSGNMREVGTTGRIPDSVGWSSELNQECGNGVRHLRGENCKFHIIRHLFR
jgi:hypothetical protein